MKHEDLSYFFEFIRKVSFRSFHMSKQQMMNKPPRRISKVTLSDKDSSTLVDIF